MLPVLAHGVIDAESHPDLLRLFNDMPDALMESKAEKTMQRYTPLWHKFTVWCAKRQVHALPAEPLIVALYLLMLTQMGLSFSTIKLASAAIAAFHTFANVVSPTEAPIVSAIRGMAKRRLPANANKKEPLSWESVVLLTELLLGDGSLLKLMVATAISVGFCAFLRFDDLSHVFVDTLGIFDGHLEIFLESRKNDQFRQGSWIVVSAIPGCVACPVSLVKSLIRTARLTGHRPLFSAVVAGLRGEERYKDTPVSYPYLREHVIAAFERIGLSSKEFGLHSLRAGGATMAANLGVPDRFIREHGGWKSQSAAEGYYKSSLEAKLTVTKAMFPQPQDL